MTYSKTIISVLFGASLLLALFHDLAIRLSWYYLYPIVDVPIHILGGIVVALFLYIITASASRSGQPTRPNFLILVFGTFLIAVAWEAFELIFFLTKDAGLSYETLSDIIFGVVGAAFGWVFVRLLVGKKIPDAGDVR